MPIDVIRVLRETSLLGSVSTQELEAVAGVSRLRIFPRGQMVFTSGDSGDTLVVVISGRVKVVVRSADGGELTLTIIRPGGVFGELSVADDGPRSADAQTLEESRLLFIPREAVQDICARRPSAEEALTRALAATLRRLTEAVSDLVFLDLPRRIAKILLSQPVDSSGSIRLKMSQEELAHQAAGTRQSVNTALRGFEKRGWVEIHDRGVSVRQAAALRQFAASNMPAS
jgi:CRP-like cAMP-binding protein